MNSDRIKEIQETTAYPESTSVKRALLQVWSECEQELKSDLLNTVIEIKPETQKPLDFIREKFGIKGVGETYTMPKISAYKCASFITEYIKKHSR